MEFNKNQENVNKIIIIINKLTVNNLLNIFSFLLFDELQNNLSIFCFFYRKHFSYIETLLFG